MANSRFYNKIKNATIERQVEDVYNEGIAFYFKEKDGSPLQFTYPYGCDGLVQTWTETGKMVKLLMEYKFDIDFASSAQRAKVIVQVLYYMKRFEMEGQNLPFVVLIGDINECFVFHSNDILKYLDWDIDWNISPSHAAEKNPDLVMAIANDEVINPFVFVIDDNFSFKTVADKIKELADNVQRYVHVTEHNISAIFEYFTNRVITNKKKISANDIVAVFMGVITKNENYYKHPNKKNTLVTPLGDVKINGESYDAFFSYFNRNYTPQEKNRFAEISDRLIEDTNRRNKGEFYTPTLFVDYAHDMISKEFGEDWKERYVVWDNSAGTCNLTRDYYFKELYSSTLEQAELDLSANYNKEATKFQFDFLNDPLEKLPKGLIEAFEQNKPIIFFMNPPYATAASGKGRNSKTGIVKTRINEKMLNDKIGVCSANLYAQFLYRCLLIKQHYNLTNCNICLFCKPNYMSGPAYTNFRSSFFKEFKYTGGILFNAKHFADCSDKWGISFSIWTNGVTENPTEFVHSLVNVDGGEIVKSEEKNIYNIDGVTSCSDWVKPNEHKEKVDAVYLSSPINTRDDKKFNAYLSKDSLGGYINSGNNIQNSGQHCYISSASISTSTGALSYIVKENFTRICCGFSARKLVIGNWVNDKDEFMAPDTTNEKWQEFENDSIVYSLFNTSSNQSSLRQVEYKGKKWDIKNEFFWMSKDVMMALAEEFSNDYCYNDARVSDERYVYRLLQGMELSREARDVLLKATQIVAKSFPYRQMFNDEHPEYQVLNWDVGWYQIKAIAKEYLKDDLEDFKTLYKRLSEKMLPMVYELGFLRK